MSSHNFNARFMSIPSELYRHLHQNYGAYRPESFIRGLWLKQMPPEVQVILAAFHDKGPEEITAVADAVMRVVDTHRKKNDVGYRDLLLLQRIDMLSDKVERLNTDVRWILKWKATVDKESEVKAFKSTNELKPLPESWLRNQKSKCVVRPPDICRAKEQKSKSVLKTPMLETWRIKSQPRVRSVSPPSPTRLRYMGSPRKESLASVKTYSIQY